MLSKLAGLDKRLAGQPNTILTGILVLLALALLWIAAKGKPKTKLAAAGWAILP